MNVEVLLKDPDMLVLDSLADAYVKPVKTGYKTTPVVEYDMNGCFIAAYNSATEAAKKTGISHSHIINICKGRQLYAGNPNYTVRIFLYRGEDIAKRLQEIEERKHTWRILYPQCTSAKEVCEYTLGGRLLFKYPTIKQAAQVNKVTTNLITYCCKGNRLFIGNRIFLYSDGDIKQRVREVKAELYKLSNKRPKYKPVDVYTLDGTFIQGYPSASAASRDLDVHVSDITRCCNGIDYKGYNYLSAKGKIFLWCGDSISDRIEQIKKKQKK